jgi:hypothetical protein
VVVDGWMVFFFGVGAALCVVATAVPLRLALRKMETFEF